MTKARALAEGTTNAEVLRQKQAHCVQETERKSGRLKPSVLEEERKDEVREGGMP